MSLLVKRLVSEAVLPARQSPEAAGYDLTCITDETIRPGARKCISTGIAIAIEPGHYGRIAPRSSLAVKNGIQVGAGVIDSDYRGEIKVLLFNNGMEKVDLPAGSRIAQIIIEKISTPIVIEVEDLNSTIRGEGGFGSTGI